MRTIHSFRILHNIKASDDVEKNAERVDISPGYDEDLTVKIKFYKDKSKEQWVLN